MAHPDEHTPKFSSDRRTRAQQMVQAGLIGGAGRGQGRKPKGQSASEQVADLAEREAPAIKRAFSDALRDRNPRTRLLGAKELLAEERRERDRQSYEAYLRALPPAELDAMLLGMLEDSLGIDLSSLLPEIVDAVIVDDFPSLPELATPKPIGIGRPTA